MKAKNKRISVPSMHDRVTAHMEAEAEARKHAFAGIEHATAGRMGQARVEEKKAEAAHRRMTELERLTAHVLKHPDER